ncbi:MAG: aminotransferase class I/II-fold pyridoxal phosphate-dependent enzyme [Ignavibacteriales bacterium]|nr:aminotransferase class I/II-fold pyridoxal phosphate-dependent enzyme [Ignavibacteriales bacterium]
MPLSPFALERYFAQHEFTARYLLSSSDCETLSQSDLLGMADTKTRLLWEHLRLGYTESPGHPLLRQEIANLCKTVWPDDVLVLAPEEGIFVAMNTLLQEGDHAIVMTPAYQSLYQIAESLRADVSRWQLETDGVRWKLDLTALARLVRPTTKLLIINVPHNPTGFHIDAETQEQIIQFAREKRLILFSDEMYRFSEYTAEMRLPAACDLYDQAITLGGLSKSFGLAGLRIGWLACKDRTIIRRFQRFRDYTTICNSAPAEILAAMALRSRDRILDRTRTIIENNLAAADQFFANHHRHFEWIRPMAGPVAFPRLKGTDSIDRFCEKLIQSKSVLLVPGSIFDFPDNHFRIGLGRRNLEEGLEKLGEFLVEHYV